MRSDRRQIDSCAGMSVNTGPSTSSTAVDFAPSKITVGDSAAPTGLSRFNRSLSQECATLLLGYCRRLPPGAFVGGSIGFSSDSVGGMPIDAQDDSQLWNAAERSASQ